MKQRKCDTLSVSLSINIKNNKQDLFKISTVCPKMRLNGEQMDMYSASQIFLLQKQIAVISHLFEEISMSQTLLRYLQSKVKDVSMNSKKIIIIITFT